MKKLIIMCAIVCAAFTGNAQSTERQLIADETWLKQSSASITVITSNDKIKEEIVSKYKDSFNRMTAAKKKDRHGQYWEYSFNFKRDVWQSLNFKL